MLVEVASNPVTANLQERLHEYTDRVEQARSPDRVLEVLHAFTNASLPLSVLAAAKFPLKSNDWGAVALGKSIFIHLDVPAGWWEDYQLLAEGRFGSFRQVRAGARTHLRPGQGRQQVVAAQRRWWASGERECPII
jgi:hypothetical protein